MPSKLPGHVLSALFRLVTDRRQYFTEDQPRTNASSELNARLRQMEDRLEVLKVRTDPRASAHAVSTHGYREEALDGLATELELTDGGQIVLYVLPCPSTVPHLSRTQIQDRRILLPSTPSLSSKATRKGSFGLVLLAFT